MDIGAVRDEFPILKKSVNGRPLVYLDNAATTHKPRVVLEKVAAFCAEAYGNPHRASHGLGAEATAAYEGARETVRRFINARDAREIIFTRGTTESINLVAHSFGERFIHEGDEIVLTEMEHHSNIVPWQVLCRRKGAKLKVLRFDDGGDLLTDALDELVTPRTRLICVTYVSNVLGVVNDIKRIVRKAREWGVPVLVDAAQAVQHFHVDVRDLGCDFLAFSGHKMYADTGIGVLYGKENWLEEMPPYQSGGGMIERVSFDETVYAGLPYKFEAGTGNITAAVSLAAAIDFLLELGMEDVASHDRDLMDYARARLASVEGVSLYGNGAGRCGALSFNLDGIHPYDAGAILDKLGIAVRTGTHCAEPVMRRFGVPGMIRASFAVYSARDEVDAMLEGLRRVQAMMGASAE